MPISNSDSVGLIVKVDEASSTVTYVGEANPGTSTAQSLWRIKKLTESGALLSVEYAEGNPGFAHIWNNRASLSYS